MRASTWLVALGASFSVISASVASEIDDLLQYAGIYRLGAHHLVSVDVMTSGADEPALVYTDLDTHQIRRMVRDGRDVFVTGPTFSSARPEQHRFQFQRDSSGRVVAVEWTEEALQRKQSGHRQPLVREDVSFSSGALTLRGTLHEPVCRSGPLPLIVWLHGSSRAQRYGLFGLPQILAHHGFAVLAYDKRGVGASQGDYVSAGFEELAADAAAALAAMKSRSEIDSRRMGVMGTSQGGWLAFRTANLSSDVRFIVDLYGTPVPVGDQMLFDLRKELEAEKFTRSEIEAALAMQTRVIEYMREGSGWDALSEIAARAHDQPWFKHVFISYEGTLTPHIRDTGVAKMTRHEPLADIRAFRGPVLYMLGDFDRLVDVDRSTATMAEALTAGGNPDFTIVVLPKAHHGLTLGVTGDADERFSGMSTSFKLTSLVPGYIDILIRWLQTRVGAVGGCQP